MPWEDRMRAVAILLLSALGLSSAALAESPKDWADCASNEVERSIPGCDKIIARAKDTKANLAIAYSKPRQRLPEQGRPR
jgi:hypothetical protein